MATTGVYLLVNLQEIISEKSSDVFRFDLGRLLQGQMRIARLRVLITHLLLVLEVCNVKSNCRKSCTRNLLMLLRFDLGPLLQGQMKIAKLKNAYKSLIIKKNAVYLQNHASCPFTVDISCI